MCVSAKLARTVGVLLALRDAQSLLPPTKTASSPASRLGPVAVCNPMPKGDTDLLLKCRGFAFLQRDKRSGGGSLH